FENPGEAIAALIASQKRIDNALKVVSSRLKVEKTEDLAGALDQVIAARQKAEADLKTAEKMLRMAQDGTSRSEEALAALRKEATEQAKASLAKLEDATTREAAARKAVAEFTAARKEADLSWQTLAAKLRSAGLITERAASPDILQVVDRILASNSA